MSGNNYNDDFKIRGIKQYWLRDELGNFIGGKNENIKSRMKPIAAGNTFTGKVRLKNLTEDELGLLLWSIRLEKGCTMNVGMGKPFGYGRIKLENIDLKLYDTNRMYGESLSLDPNSIFRNGTKSVDKFIEGYKSYIWDNFLDERIDDTEKKKRKGSKNSVNDMDSVKALIGMKTYCPEPEKIKYMSLSRTVNGKNIKEYQNRHPLNAAGKIIKETKVEKTKAEKKQESRKQTENPTGKVI